MLEAGKDLVADHIDKVKEVIVIGHRKQAAAAFRAIRRHRHSSGASAPLMRARRLGEERPGQGEVDAFDLRAIVEKAEKIEEVHKRALFKAAGGKCQMKQVTPHLKIQVTDPARRARGWQLFDESMVYGTCPPL